MLHEAILTMLLLGFAPGSTDVLAPDDPLCFTPPAAPVRVNASHFEDTSADGTRTFGAEATYQLSSGEIGEAFLTIDFTGAGEAQLMIDGEIIAHVAISMDPAMLQPVLTTWQPPEVSAEADSIAEMMRVDLPLVLVESLPQEFKCSGWAKKLLHAGKYLWTGAVAAAGIACCVSVTRGCVVYGASAAVVGEYVHDNWRTTVTDQVCAEHRNLLDKPQRLGILPTRWFWRDPDVSKHARWLMAPLAGLGVLIVMSLDLHPLVAGLVVAVALTLANGLLEKYVRRQAIKRRTLREAGGESLPR